ncbi:MAG: DUF1566 domain-containing protein [Candidatus Electrothrix sp. MAN1_4]|nr:DUF1566 domain-containing protein [Candidatus Electrothrix sp. MAN1_4]
MNANNWIGHLQHPLVLAGFGLFLFALVVKPLFLSNKKLSSTAMERVLHKAMVLLFILAVMAILAGFLLSWKATPAAVKNGNDLTMTKAQFTAMLEQQERSIKTMLFSVSGDKKKRHLLEQRLESVQKQQANIQRSYKIALKERNKTGLLAVEMQEQVPAAQISQIKRGYQQDSINAQRDDEESNMPIISDSEYSSGPNYSEMTVTLPNTPSLTIDEIQILHDAGVRVQFSGQSTSQLLPAETSFSELLQVEVLDLAGFSLYIIPPWLKRFTNLRRLDLSKNHLDADSDLQETLQAMPKLDVLNLSDNPLFAKEPATSQSLAPVWQRLTELGELYLSGTGGTAQNYGSLAPLWSLKVLDISRNRIKNEIKILELNKLVGLLKLNLSHNDISRFPGTKLPVQRLELLDLSYNDLTEIPYVAMPQLNIWYLQGNGAVRLADDYGDMFALPNLMTLQYDSGSDYDAPSSLPKGLIEKLVKMFEQEYKLLCSDGSISLGKYTDYCDGTVGDIETGFMWTRCSEGLSGDYCNKGEAKSYKWKDAIQRANNTMYAGYSDWRLPTIDELKTLVECGNGIKKDGLCRDGTKKPTINQHAFPNTRPSCYWSGDSFAYNNDYAWHTNFYNGQSHFTNRNNTHLVRLVRGGQ